MIELTKGDILTADVEALVNTVNCAGIMGRGIALQFRKAFPDNFREYAQACKRGQVEPGRMLVHETGRLTGPKYIINFPTKRHWRGSSRLADIESGLVALVEVINRLGIVSIAVPPLGCGLGGLQWSDVRPRIEKALANVPDIHAVVYEPAGAPQASRMVRSSTAPKMTPGIAALVGLIQRYRAGLMDPFVSLLEVHKLMYFLQEAGQGMRLRYAKAVYGPYAENLRHPLITMEGHLTSGYGDGADNPDKQLDLVPGAARDAAEFLEHHPETVARFDRVADLVDGFETPFGLELLSTVHWVATREGATTTDKAVAATYAWSERKRQFTRRQIELAFNVLQSKGWIAAVA
jgi:O-acetyl-ADP-ribose deacetylase (regulator of RNase III)